MAFQQKIIQYILHVGVNNFCRIGSKILHRMHGNRSKIEFLPLHTGRHRGRPLQRKIPDFPRKAGDKSFLAGIHFSRDYAEIIVVLWLFWSIFEMKV